MRMVPDSITQTWLGGEFTGSRRPMARITIQTMGIRLQTVDPKRVFASAIFGQLQTPVEIPNVKSVQWDRSVGQDAASCTIVLYNTAPLPLGSLPIGNDLDQPGYYTYNYGATSWSSSRWGQTANSWKDFIVPDRIVRTYEGYGFDATKCPEKDPHLVQTGMWLIDDVEYTHDGLITVTCRDLGRLLLDHIMFPPVIPLDAYPLLLTPTHPVDDPPSTSSVGGQWKPTYYDDSGRVWYGKNHELYGHKPSHAFDGSDSTYWLSVGNGQPHADYAYEWVEGTCGGKTLSAVDFKTWGGPYHAYLSVKIKGKWQGSATIPYNPKAVPAHPNGGNIPFVQQTTAAREGTTSFRFPHPLEKVDAIRITLHDLTNSRLGQWKYRAGIRTITCSSAHTVTNPGTTHQEGDYDDYTEIVKYLLSCGGFYWPHSNFNTITLQDGTVQHVTFPTDDPFLKRGRVWGDLEMSGTKAIYVEGDIGNLGADWDKKPLMDGIAYVRDLLGYIFFIDETGGAVFRLPNWFSLGNFVGDTAAHAGYVTSPDGHLPPYTVKAGDNWITVAAKFGVTEAEMLAANSERGGSALRVGEQLIVPWEGLGKDPIITIDERQTLIGLRAKISSKNIREYVFVANSNGQFGATSAGYNPIKPDPGFRRVGGWTDQNFRDQAEAQRMADMITLQQALSYRTNTLTIVANPSIQIDDQVKLYERVTGEGFYHYVRSIKSSNDLESGMWKYDLETTWLGETPLGHWAVDKSKLGSATLMFLETVLASRTIPDGLGA